VLAREERLRKVCRPLNGAVYRSVRRRRRVRLGRAGGLREPDPALGPVRRSRRRTGPAAGRRIR